MLTGRGVRSQHPLYKGLPRKKSQCSHSFSLCTRFVLFCFVFWLCLQACGILVVPRPRIEPWPRQ